MATLGERIRDLREFKDISQLELAKKIGVSSVVLSRYESGARKPDYESLKKIAVILDVSLDYLLGHSVDGEMQTVMGKQVDLSTLSENQRIVLDWAMSQSELSFDNMDKKELEQILANLSVIFEYEKNKKNSKKN